MRATYEVSRNAPAGANGPVAVGSGDTSKNISLGFNIGDVSFSIQPQPGDREIDIPAKVLRNPHVRASGLTPVAGGLGPHEDFMYLADSTEYTYTTREVISGGVVEKHMPAGARVGNEGTMVLYKDAATVGDIGVGNWSERLVRPFVITAADLTDRQTGWPSSGSAPTIDIDTKSIVDNGGDGYNHV